MSDYRRYRKAATGIFVMGILLIGSFFCLRETGRRNLIVGEEQNVASVIYQGKEYKYKENMINILCLGIDKDLPIEEKRESGSEGLADAVLLVSIDMQEKELYLLAIPRDTTISIKVQDTKGEFVRTEKGQITLQYAYGETAENSCELMMEAVSNLLYQIPIQRYCSINFQAVPLLNDAIGGVDVKVLEDIQGDHCILYEGRNVHLEGYEALDYIRWRDEETTASSMTRLDRQKQYMRNYFEQAKTVVKSNPTLPVRVYQQLEGNICTSITIEDLTYLVPELMDISFEEEYLYVIPGEVVQSGKYEEYHIREDELKEMILDIFYETV